MSAASPRRATRSWQIVTLVTLAAWGLLHIAGGGTLIFETFADGGSAGFASLGSAADSSELPLAPGAVGEAVLGFHGLDLLLGGVAVALLAAVAWRSGWPNGVSTALAVALVFDVGLVIFLLVPGHMNLGEGLWGPLLLGVAVPAAWIAGWRPRQL